MPSCDAIIIGGGTNGLACAARLAGAGRKVVVVEAEAEAGGAVRRHEVWPGYAASLAHLAHMIDPRVVSGMDLARHGLEYVAANVGTTALSAGGDHLLLGGAFGAEVTGGDAGWPPLRRQLLRFAEVLAPFRAMTPPRLGRGVGNDHLRLAKLGMGVRMLGKAEFRELMRMFLINVWDVLNDELTDERLKGVIGFDATLGSWLGPRSPNSLILLLNRIAGESGGLRGALALPKGGMAAVGVAMARGAEAAGVNVRKGVAVERVIIAGDRATGVRLAGGEEISAGIVISAISPKTTFLTLVGVEHLDTGFVSRLRVQKSRGATAKLHLALTGVPDFRGADLKTRLVIAPSLDAVETAFNAVKYGEVPARPVMEVILPSAFEAGHAPEGCHLLSANVQFAPHAPKAGQDAARAEMLANALAVLEDHAPGIGGLVAKAEMLMPYDIEARYGMVGGNWHHGELSVEQMFFLRPLPGLSQYQTPIAGLWLAGAGSHPGGGISGAAGWNAAERILKEARG